jgi:predicted ATP-dependent serine protease
LLAVLSSFKNRVLPKDLIVFGELGLTGEVRHVANGRQRLSEARKARFPPRPYDDRAPSARGASGSREARK